MFAKKLVFSLFSSKKLALALVFALGTIAFPTRAQEADPAILSGATLSKVQVEDLTLMIGEQKVISSDDVRSYSEGRKGIVDIRLTKDSSQFVIVGLKPGHTTLLFLMMDGKERHLKIKVEDPDGGAAVGEGSVHARDNIRLDFYFVQVNKSYGHQIGANWPAAYGVSTFEASYDLTTNFFGNASAVISEQPLPYLDLAQTSGWAKVMRKAAVVTTNGEKAAFSGGGEVNLLVQSAVGTGVQQISFGSLIEVEPAYDSETGRIELRLHADISELEDDRGTGVPGRLTTTLDTVINIDLGQSLILAGLTSMSKRRSKRGIPGLSQIPILGLLFGTQSQAEEESENIVIIVPTVVDAVTMQDRKRLKDAMNAYETYAGDISKVELVPESKPQKPSAQTKRQEGR